MTGIVELKEEEDEQEGQEEEDCYDEVFSLELERGDRGLGLALVDAKVSAGTECFYVYSSLTGSHSSPRGETTCDVLSLAGFFPDSERRLHPCSAPRLPCSPV